MDHPQELRRTYRGIGHGDSVALGDKLRIGARNDAMHEEPAFACEENDVAENYVIDCATANPQDVARPDRRQHAGTRNPEE